MILYSRVTDAPAEEPVTNDDAKLHLKVTDSTEDTYILNLIKTATKLCESDSGLSFITQERTVKLDYFPCEIIIPYGPVVSIDTFTYVDSDGATQNMVENTDYYLDTSSELARIKPVDEWPTTKDKLNAVNIVYTAGYGAAADVPEVIKQAILMQVASLYENRQDEVNGNMFSLNWSSRRLLDSVRVDWYAKY